ncbi:unnamed protein product [Rhizophagus irregularis]|nr:unnamed protein product [Rhizophagus irregularis]
MLVLERLVNDKVDWYLDELGSCDKERFRIFVLTQLLPQMNPYPAKHSVLVMDNAHIHHDDDLVTAIENIGDEPFVFYQFY